MKFKIDKNLNEDWEVIPGITFRDLMDAALDNDYDFVINPPGVEGSINIPTENWIDLYSALFKVDEDSEYETSEDYLKEKERSHQFAKRYNNV